MRTLLVGQETCTSASVGDENTRSSNLRSEREDLPIPSDGGIMNIDLLVVEILEQGLIGNTIEELVEPPSQATRL